MQRQSIKSSTIKSAAWEESTETLEIEFNSLAVYQYAGVPKKTWEAFLAAKSRGSFFMACIRGQFDYVCITPKPEKEHVYLCKQKEKNQPACREDCTCWCHEKEKKHGQPEEKEEGKTVTRKAVKSKN